jgi:ADP-dependent phosphofructokinase/glucokinase
MRTTPSTPTTSDPDPSPSATVLGLGGCLDYETVWDPHVLSALASHYGIGEADLDRGELVATERALACSILAFVRDGVGGERGVATPDVIDELAGRLEHTVTLGGSSVRAAIAMSRIGVPSTLHLVSEDDQVRALLPNGIEYVCSAESDAINPHLVMQYPQGTRVRLADGVAIEAPRSNRLIYVCDPPNRDMVLAPELTAVLMRARLFFISGFNAMLDQDLLRERMRTLVDSMTSLPPDATVVFEDAGYHLPGFERIVNEALAGRVDVHGMNEDELETYVGRPVDLLDGADVAEAIAQVRQVIMAPVLVVHTRHWALAHGADVQGFRDVLKGGIDMASARYLYGDDLDARRYAGVREWPRQRDGETFAHQLSSALGPQAVCVAARELATEVPTTIGLGDAFVGGMLAALATT